MTSTVKINNSYESEPSSGSGSVASEHTDYINMDDHHMKLRDLLRPAEYQNESVATGLAIDTRCHSEIPKGRLMRFGVPIHSSQESSFEGFANSPFEKFHRLLLGNCTQPVLEPNPPIDEVKISPVKLSAAKFYDTVVEENSCNAVDIKLANNSKAQFQRRGSSNGTYNVNPSTELTFDGKINRLTDNHEPKITDNMTLSCPPTASTCPVALVKESTAERPDSFVLKRYNNEKSPDLFEEEDYDDENDCKPSEIKETQMHSQSKEKDNTFDRSFFCPTESSFADEQTMESSKQENDYLHLFRDNCRREKELLRRVRKCLAGVPPPPSLTIPQLNMFDAVLSRKTEILTFFNDMSQTSNACDNNQVKSLLKPTHSLDEARATSWKDILGVRQHGICFNISQASENNEYLSLSVVDRFIGAETTSSYYHSPTSTKKRTLRLKMLTQSPGNRLSHLAKRRAVFSSASLATSLKCSTSRGPQIAIDKKKIKNKRKITTPKRKTPGSKRKSRKTPSSSARKRHYRTDTSKKTALSRETSKRALFQSPAKHFGQKLVAPKPVIKPEIANRVEKSKRALFSPEVPSQNINTATYSGANTQSSTQSSLSSEEVQPFIDSFLKRKRNPAEDEGDLCEFGSQHNKLFRGNGESLTPRALKIKSQSFCIGAGSSFAACTPFSIPNKAALTFGKSKTLESNNSSLDLKIQRAHSDITSNENGLTQNQRKKLLWAVSQALQEKKITAKHESFKQYAAVLARVVRRIFQEYYQKSSTSNSETMLRLAKRYAFNVISGGSVDDIYYQAKTQIHTQQKQSLTRLSGYIGPEEYQQRKLSQTLSQQGRNNLMSSMPSIFSMDSSMDSFSMSISQTSSTYCGTSSGISVSQSSFIGRISEDMPVQQCLSFGPYNLSATKNLPIMPNTALQNSSSKNNLGGIALRENVDCEQRRSAQKNFTGKDQQNVSPYTVVSSTSFATTPALNSGMKAQLITELNSAGAKAKRQISFDC